MTEPSQDASVSDEVAMHVAALDSLETILFGDCWRRSRDEMEARASALVEAVEAARTLRSFQRAFEPEHRGLPDIRTRLDDKLEVFGEL